MLKFAQSGNSKKKKEKSRRKLVQSPSQDSTSSIDSQDGENVSVTETDSSPDDGHASDGAISETGTVKRRRSSKVDSKKASLQRYSNGSALSENSSPIPFKAFIGGGKRGLLIFFIFYVNFIFIQLSFFCKFTTFNSLKFKLLMEFNRKTIMVEHN